MVLRNPDCPGDTGQLVSASFGQFKRRSVLQFKLKMFTLDDHDTPPDSADIPNGPAK